MVETTPHESPTITGRFPVMIESIFAGLWAGYGLSVQVGAVAVLMVDMTARSSFRMGAAAAMGAVSADGLYAIAAVLGGAALAAVIQPSRDLYDGRRR